MKLEEIFEVRNGIASSGLEVMDSPAPDSIPFIRPASTQQRTIAGWVRRKSVKKESIYPEGSLFVSTNGEGSHTYAYVSRFEFVPNSDVSVLIPKHGMTLQEKVFYARCITMNRYRFSYGRKPKGDRLRNIELPDVAPDWAKSVVVSDDSKWADVSSDAKVALDTSAWKPFEIQSLFEIKKGKRLTKSDMSKGKTPFIGAIETRNGVTALIGQEPIHKGGTITVSYNGSVGEAFYQPVPFWATDDVNVLYPIFETEMTPEIALFICAVIRHEKYRFSYGRKWHLERMRTHKIYLPSLDGKTPDFNLMERYMKSLPYSSQVANGEPAKTGGGQDAEPKPNPSATN